MSFLGFCVSFLCLCRKRPPLSIPPRMSLLSLSMRLRPLLYPSPYVLLKPPYIPLKLPYVLLKPPYVLPKGPYVPPKPTLCPS